MYDSMSKYMKNAPALQHALNPAFEGTLRSLFFNVPGARVSECEHVVNTIEKLAQFVVVYRHVLMDQYVSQAYHCLKLVRQVGSDVTILLKNLNTLSIVLRIAEIKLANDVAGNVNDNLDALKQTIAKRPLLREVVPRG
jgi:hypothetical protein